MKIGEIVRAGIKAGKSNEVILGEVLAAHPAANTSTKTIAWYRSDLKKKGVSPKETTSLSTPKTETVVEPGALKIEVRNYQHVNGHDGQGYRANLYINGKKVATLFDDGWGGPLDIGWFDHALPRVTTKVRDFKGEFKEVQLTPTEALLANHIRDLTYEAFGQTSYHNLETYIDHFVQKAALLSEASKLQNPKKLRFLKSDGKIYEVKTGVTRAQVLAKNPDAKFLMDMDINEVVELIRQVGE